MTTTGQWQVQCSISVSMSMSISIICQCPLQFDQETSKRLRRERPWPLTESRGRKIAIGPRPANLKSDYAASLINEFSKLQFPSSLCDNNDWISIHRWSSKIAKVQLSRGRASVAKQEKILLVPMTNMDAKKFGFWLAGAMCPWHSAPASQRQCWVAGAVKNHAF